SANQSQVAVYGARRSSDGALTVVLVNKTDGQLTSPVSLAGFTSGPAAQVWRWTTPGGGIARQADQSVCGGSFQLTLAPKSITMLVVPAGDGTCPTAT